MAGYRGNRAGSRRVVRDPNRSGEYRVITIHYAGDGDEDMGRNEHLVVSNSGRFMTGKSGVEWERINIHHKGDNLEEARNIMKRLSGEWI